jgi:hypothetical protein
MMGRTVGMPVDAVGIVIVIAVAEMEPEILASRSIDWELRDDPESKVPRGPLHRFQLVFGLMSVSMLRDL